MSESQHSDSEFYYPGELEMLQLPTHSEATERKSLPLETKQCCRARPRSTKE